MRLEVAKMTNSIITIIIVEDDPLYNQALKKVIDNTLNLSCVAQCYTFEDAFSQIKIHNPFIALVDIRLGDKSGVQLIEELKVENLRTQYIICSSFEDDQNIIDALKSGASGYLVKGESMDKIVGSIKETNEGGVPLTSSVARKILHQFKDEKEGFKILTKTEQDIIKLLATGLMYKEIALQQNISLDTVRKHLSNIYKKLGVNNKVEAINKVTGLK